MEKSNLGIQDTVLETSQKWCQNENLLIFHFLWGFDRFHRVIWVGFNEEFGIFQGHTSII
jgi:hypothetical protein